MKKEKLINDVLNLYSALNNVFFEDHYLRRRITRREKEFLLKRSITSETPLELLNDNIKRYVNIFYADFISNEKEFDKYNDKQKNHLIKLNDLIKKSKEDTQKLITNEFARIFALGNDYIQNATLLEKSLTKILNTSEDEITSLSRQINSCMLLWDYEKEGYYTYKLIANDDACEECEKLNGKELSIKEFSENEFFPLVHPNCKCRLQIINENGEDVTFIDEIPPHKEKMSLLDQISNFLAVASFIPGFDTFTNFASIPVDLLRGDFLSAGLDVIGVIPVIGEAADIAKTINKADDIADFAKLVSKADDASDVGKAIDKVDDFAEFPKKIHTGRQGKHIVGHNNYREGKSIFEGTMTDAEELIKKYSGTGTKIGANRERIDFKIEIGNYVDPKTGKNIKTTIGTIHYSSNGTHIVPEKPNNWR